MTTTIIALCGPSCSGKSTLQKKISNNFLYMYNIPPIRIVSSTTRPKRNGEVNGTDYWFDTEKDFYKDLADGSVLEYTNFRGWTYWTRRSSFKKDSVNIAIFDRHGIENIVNQMTKFPEGTKLIIVYLTIPWFYRLYRSAKREGKFKLEHVRRMVADWKDFSHFTEKIGDKIIYQNRLAANRFANRTIILNTVKALPEKTVEHRVMEVICKQM